MFLFEECCLENLLPTSRADVLDVFREFDLKWHDGPNRQTPSNFLMDSMVYCANALGPFTRDGRALAALLRPLIPDAVEAVEVENGRVLTFEWIGLENYLREPSPRRKRGEYGTSVDAHCVLRLKSGRRMGVLIEWKYFEEYDYGVSKRHWFDTYAPLISAPDSPINSAACGGVDALFFDPFYQLMRGQLLAAAMERAHENGVDEVKYLLIVPTGNRAFLDRLTSPEIERRFPRHTVPDVWRMVLKNPSRFAAMSFDELIRPLDVDASDILTALSEVRSRYLEGRND